MPAERVSMRRVREILRLKHEGGASDREIARALSIARSTVALTLERTAAAGLRWPLPATLTDRVLEAMLYAGHGNQQGARRKGETDGACIYTSCAGPASRRCSPRRRPGSPSRTATATAAGASPT